MQDSLNLAPPYAFNYHYDAPVAGQPPVFRGLAFANFKTPAETAAALAALNGYEIQGRRLRVEFKRMLRYGEKEKIEREKALKRMRSAVGLASNTGSPSSTHYSPVVPSVPSIPMHVRQQSGEYSDDQSRYEAQWNAVNVNSSPAHREYESSATSISTSPVSQFAMSGATVNTGSPSSSDLESGPEISYTSSQYAPPAMQAPMGYMSTPPTSSKSKTG